MMICFVFILQFIPESHGSTVKLPPIPQAPTLLTAATPSGKYDGSSLYHYRRSRKINESVSKLV